MLKNFLILTITLFLISIPGYSFAQDTTAQDYLNRGVQLSENPDTYNEAFTNLQNVVTLLPKGDSRLRIAYTKLAKIYNYWGIYDDAIKYCNYVFDLDPKYLEARKYFGMANFHKGNYSEAIESLKKWIKDQPSDIEAIEYLGLCYMNRKDYTKAMEELAKVRTVRGRAIFHEAQQLYLVEQVRPTYEEGLEYFNKGDWERAIAKFHECLLRAPSYEVAKDKLKQSEQNWIADLEEKLIENPQNIQLRDALKTLVGAKEGAIDFYYNGLLDFEKRQWGKAYRKFERVLEIDPQNDQAKERKTATLNYWIKALEDSLAMEENLGNRNLMFELSYALAKVGKDINYVLPYYHGLKFYRLGNWENAFLNLDQVPRTSTYFTKVENMRNIAISRWINNILDSLSHTPADSNLTSDLEMALLKAGKPCDWVRPYYEGLKLYRQGNWQNAVLRFDKVPEAFEHFDEVKAMRDYALSKWIEVLEDSLSKKPDSLELRDNLVKALLKAQIDPKYVEPYYDGLQFYKLSLWDKAVGAFAKVSKSYRKYNEVSAVRSYSLGKWLNNILKRIENDPSAVSSRVKLRDALGNVGEEELYKNVVDSCRVRLEENPQNNQCLLNLAIAYYIQKDYDKAMECYKKAVKLDRNFLEYDDVFKPRESYLISFELARFYISLGIFTKALERLQEIPEDSPFRFERAWYLGFLYSKLRSRDTACGVYSSLLSRKETHRKLITRLNEIMDCEDAECAEILLYAGLACREGEVKRSVNNVGNSLRYIRAAGSLRPDDPEIMNAVVALVELKEDKKRINRLFEVAAEIKEYQRNEELSKVKYSISEFYDEAQKISDPEVRELFLRAKLVTDAAEWIHIKEREFEIEDLFKKAEAYMQNAQWERAIRIYEVIRTVDPDNRDALVGLIEANEGLVEVRKNERERNALYYGAGIAGTILFGMILSISLYVRIMGSKTRLV